MVYAREITIGISERYIENQNTVNHILLILRCYIYRCRYKGEITYLHGGLQDLKCYIKIEKNSTFYISSKQKEQIDIKKNGLILRRQCIADYLWIHVVFAFFLYFKFLVWKQNNFLNIYYFVYLSFILYVLKFICI